MAAVRRQDTAPHRKPSEPLLHQLAKAGGNEEESGWVGDALHPEKLARKRQRVQLAAGT